MMKGPHRHPDKDPKTWRSRARKKRKQPAVAFAIPVQVLFRQLGDCGLKMEYRTLPDLEPIWV